jgi:hypothetical protein
MGTKHYDTTADMPTETNTMPKTVDDFLGELDGKIQQVLSQLREKRGTAVYPLFLGDVSIEADTVNGVFDDLCSTLQNTNARLDVIVDSSGGDIHAAYNLARLFRRFAREELNFIVPRWAKSAATLLVCGGDTIYMGPIAELGPIDPQITQFNQFEGRFEHFSPLHMEATLDLIRGEFDRGSEKLANGLLHRLQFPLTLGGIKKSLGVGKQYLVKLLTTRMFSGEQAEEKAMAIGQALVENYTDHGFCIDIDEARSIGLNVRELESDEFGLIWELYRLNAQKEELEKEARRSDMKELLKNFPEVMKAIPKTRKKSNLGNGQECLEEEASSFGKEIELT